MTVNKAADSSSRYASSFDLQGAIEQLTMQLLLSLHAADIA
jgi:hypothetical protein